MTKIYLNGRYLGRQVTGVERFASMITRNLDRLRSEGLASRLTFTILAPAGVERPDWWTGGFETVGRSRGHLWEQWDLPRRASDGVLVNLCNAGPVAHRRSLTVIHDAMPYDLPGNFRFAYRTLHRILGRTLARTSSLATVSAFSRDRLAERLALSPDRIAVIPNAADHIDDVTAEEAILDRLGLRVTPFLLFVGSFAPNKNLPAAVRAFGRLAHREARFVLVGASGKSFADNGLDDIPAGVILPGRISDAALVALYRHARALVFPSTYEGFGVPPLEALRLGCPVLCSDIPPCREVCGDAGTYFPPPDADALMRCMKDALDDPQLRDRVAARAAARSALFSWEKSARELGRHIAALAGAPDGQAGPVR